MRRGGGSIISVLERGKTDSPLFNFIGHCTPFQGLPAPALDTAFAIPTIKKCECHDALGCMIAMSDIRAMTRNMALTDKEELW
jgi:hypothetical protein